MSELPEGWVTTNLGSISQPSNEKIDPNDAPILRYIGLEHIAKDTGKLLGYGYSNEVRSTKAKFHEGALLYGKLRPYLNKATVTEFQGICSTDILVFSQQSFVSNHFLLYRFLCSDFVRYATENVTGTQHPRIDYNTLSKFPIPLAPLNEQRRIVAKLEKLLAKVDTCKERLDKIPGILKRFRQSVLSAACSGRLTADWRENNPDVESAEELLKRIYQKRKKRYEEMYEKARQEGKRKPVKPKNITSLPLELEGLDKLQINWKWTTFNEVCDDITVGYVGSMAQEYVESGVPFLRSLNVKEFRFEPTNLKYISNEFHAKLKKSALSPGDLVVVRSGNAGISCVIPETLKESNCSDLVIARPSKGLNPFYACIFINSSTTRVHIENTKVGIAQGHFNIESMRDTKLPLPPITEQQEIVRRVETLFKTADRIEQRYQKAKSYIDQLTQSILAKAFRGELVPQDPNDEPASVLLERIRAERENRENVAKTAKKPAANKKQRSKKAQPQLEPIQLELPGLE